MSQSQSKPQNPKRKPDILRGASALFCYLYLSVEIKNKTFILNEHEKNLFFELMGAQLSLNAEQIEDYKTNYLKGGNGDPVIKTIQTTAPPASKPGITDDTTAQTTNSEPLAKNEYVVESCKTQIIYNEFFKGIMKLPISVSIVLRFYELYLEKKIPSAILKNNFAQKRKREMAGKGSNNGQNNRQARGMLGKRGSPAALSNKEQSEIIQKDKETADLLRGLKEYLAILKPGHRDHKDWFQIRPLQKEIYEEILKKRLDNSALDENNKKQIMLHQILKDKKNLKIKESMFEFLNYLKDPLNPRARPLVMLLGDLISRNLNDIKRIANNMRSLKGFDMDDYIKNIRIFFECQFFRKPLSFIQIIEASKYVLKDSFGEDVDMGIVDICKDKTKAKGRKGVRQKEHPARNKRIKQTKEKREYV